jgi:hypothetical protein
MKVTRYTLHWGLIVSCVALLECRDQGSDSLADMVDLQFVDVSIGANMMPMIPPVPDPVGCRIEIILNNYSMETLSGLSIPFAELVLSPSGESIGTIALRSEWNGEVPSQSPTQVALTKTDSLSHISRIPCGETVFLRLSVLQFQRPVKTSETGVFSFGCVQLRAVGRLYSFDPRRTRRYTKALNVGKEVSEPDACRRRNG